MVLRLLDDHDERELQTDDGGAGGELDQQGGDEGGARGARLPPRRQDRPPDRIDEEDHRGEQGEPGGRELAGRPGRDRHARPAGGRPRQRRRPLARNREDRERPRDRDEGERQSGGDRAPAWVAHRGAFERDEAGRGDEREDDDGERQSIDTASPARARQRRRVGGDLGGEEGRAGRAADDERAGRGLRFDEGTGERHRSVRGLDDEAVARAGGVRRGQVRLGDDRADPPRAGRRLGDRLDGDEAQAERGRPDEQIGAAEDALFRDLGRAAAPGDRLAGGVVDRQRRSVAVGIDDAVERGEEPPRRRARIAHRAARVAQRGAHGCLARHRPRELPQALDDGRDLAAGVALEPGADRGVVAEAPGDQGMPAGADHGGRDQPDREDTSEPAEPRSERGRGHRG